MKNNIQENISFTEFILYFSYNHPYECIDEVYVLDQSEGEACSRHEELETDEFFVNFKYYYFNLINYRKLLYYLYYKTNITIESIYSYRYCIADVLDLKFIYSNITSSDKYFNIPMRYLNCYYVKKSSKFESLCNLKPEYKNLIFDIEKQFEDYLIEPDYIRALFSPISILFDLANNYTYEDTLKIILGRMIIDNSAILVEDKINEIVKVFFTSKGPDRVAINLNEILKDIHEVTKLKYNDQGDIYYCPENSRYLSWVTNNEYLDFELQQEDEDINSTTFTLKNADLSNDKNKVENHLRIMKICIDKSYVKADIKFVKSELIHFVDFSGDFFRQSIINKNFQITDLILKSGYDPNKDESNYYYIGYLLKENDIIQIYNFIKYGYCLDYFYKTKFIHLCNLST